ncbi:NUDIX hydrolase [Nocardioides sp. B-3]|uniref:NUDIX hydrolase n=1 Tax=Nocardioides sp. B-3 TaxID=2895565 RepID=UPI0021528A10|nr:NUDIX domain-containing protein [Nocardioides sp. B-3]UUZ58043.1 NUDIX domain-containing protein [Nocardioides sp. B-3]
MWTPEETASQGVVREVLEETGFHVEPTGLLEIDSFVKAPAERVIATDRWVRHLRIIYSARVTGGALGTLEVDGSTDYADWVPISSVPDLPRVPLVDVALGARLDRRRESP